MVFGDLYHIEERLKNYDPELEVEWDWNKLKYRITRRGFHVMYAQELDQRVIDKLQYWDTARRRVQDILWELQQSEDEYEKKKAKELSDYIESVTLDKFNRIMDIPTYQLGW